MVHVGCDRVHSHVCMCSFTQISPVLVGSPKLFKGGENSQKGHFSFYSMIELFRPAHFFAIVSVAEQCIDASIHFMCLQRACVYKIGVLCEPVLSLTNRTYLLKLWQKQRQTEKKTHSHTFNYTTWLKYTVNIAMTKWSTKCIWTVRHRLGHSILFGCCYTVVDCIRFSPFRVIKYFRLAFNIGHNQKFHDKIRGVCERVAIYMRPCL